MNTKLSCGHFPIANEYNKTLVSSQHFLAQVPVLLANIVRWHMFLLEKGKGARKFNWRIGTPMDCIGYLKFHEVFLFICV